MLMIYAFERDGHFELRGNRMRQLVRRPGPAIRVSLLLLLLVFCFPREGGAACVPEKGCDMAYAFYRIERGDDLGCISKKFQTTKANIQAVNPRITDVNFILIGDSLYIPFKCNCVNDQLSHTFPYRVAEDNSYTNISSIIYQNLTQPNWISTDPDFVREGAYLEIPVNCTCGNPDVNSSYGLFLTFPVVAGTGFNLSGLAWDFNTSSEVLKEFNPGVVWEDSQPTQYAFIPVPDTSGKYPPFQGGTRNAGKASNTGVVVGAVVGEIILVFFLIWALVLYYVCIYKPNRHRRPSLRLAGSLFMRTGGNHSGSASDQIHSTSSKTSSTPGSSNSFVPTALTDYSVDSKSVEFSYEELRKATNDFSVANKIGEGGFAVVFYGEIRGQKLAIKRMNLQATKEFMAELQVLTHVHHTNLVQLIGYCTTEFLFLVYEFVENGTLDQHLHSSKARMGTLSWSSRVQIALDAARGLEYIHEHTKPTYIHRDIKSANILLEKDCHAKVADFGLTKLTEAKVGNAVTQPTRVVGTWGYMSPEYACFGDVSPMMDVYSFGVVLFEILSGREAIMRGALTLTQEINSSSPSAKEGQRALVSFFDSILKAPNGIEKRPRFMDPKLCDDYPLDAAWKMAQLAGACTQELPNKRPTMQKVVVALMTLSSSTQDWEFHASLYIIRVLATRIFSIEMSNNRR